MWPDYTGSARKRGKRRQCANRRASPLSQNRAPSRASVVLPPKHDATHTVILARMPAPSDRPNRLFIVLEVPALLAGMAFPTADTDWVELHRRGFQQLVRLHPGHYDPAPLTAHEILLEDLVGGRKPLDAGSERDRVLDAARLATGCVQRGEGVVVHCVGGTGRTGTVLGCALRYLGRDADEAVAMIQAHRPHWPESLWQEEVVRTVQPS